jgi:type I restriction enzyme S subunit
MEAVGEYGGLALDGSRALDEGSSTYTEFENGDVVVAKITPCFENGKGALADGLLNGAALGTTELHVLRPFNLLNARFLFYLTISSPFRKTGEAEMYGSAGQKRVPADFIENFAVPLPPLDEQRAIADFLDAETAKLDALVEKRRRLIQLLKERRAALVSRTVTRGLPPDASRADVLDPSPMMKASGSAWLPKVPAHWELRPLGYLIKLRSGATPDKGKPEFWDGEIPWVSPKDMKRPFIDDSEDHISEEALESSPLARIPAGRVLIVVRGMILAHSFPVAFSMADVTINQDMKALECREGLEPRFLFWALNGLAHVFVSLTDESAHGTRRLETSTLTRFPFMLPPLAEQIAIADFLDKETAKIDTMITKIEAAIERLQEYRAALITAAVTGRIDVSLGGRDDFRQ